MKKIYFAACLSFLLFSCSQDSAIESQQNSENLSLENKHQLQLDVSQQQKSQDLEISENLGEMLRENAVEPSECGPTEFQYVINDYFAPIVSDPLAIEFFSLYLQLNFYHAYFFGYENEYFGENGDDTQLVNKRTRELESFWNLDREIEVRGQHTATLDDREKLADLYELVGIDVNSREDAYAIADQILAINEASPNLPENPIFATDGFAAGTGVIVIGDGLVQILGDSGIETDIVWTGILAHEWAHQLQFANTTNWYPGGISADPAESTRYTELEADFLAAYYMAHKRGATYNWKRVEGFFELFFQIGDCSFDSEDHHGTPAQRLEAAKAGFELAAETQKKGQVLTADEAHEAFVNTINEIIPVK